MNISAHTPLDLAAPILEPLQETAFSIAFARLLPTFARFIEAERDLGDICHSYDPAYGVWNRDGRLARAGLDALLLQFHRLPVHRPEDRPLQRMVSLVDAMLNSNQPELPRHLHRQMQLVFFQRYQVRSFGPTAQHRNAMLVHAFHLVDAMIRLPLFDFSPECAIAPDTETQTDNLSPRFF